MALQRPAGAKSSTRGAADSDLPVEYLNSSLSQQVQVGFSALLKQRNKLRLWFAFLFAKTPARKSEQELKEEEELQLALALSQSEAEHKKQPSSVTSYRMQQRSPSPEPVQQQLPVQQQQEESNPELAKYLNRSYWEQRKISESSSMASPSAPSPMPPTPQPQQQQQLLQTLPLPKNADEVQIDEFAANMRTQVEIFVNRMKSNSSRGRSISNDSSVQTLFMTLTSLHSQQLTYIKEMDDKRMWYEQLQDKLAQIKDSRAALDVLRQEHVEKLRRIAEEQERQRQLQMAQKLEIMRKKKQEYLQYQRQLALQRIQEQEREMQLRQEQQKAQYLMGQTAPFPYLPPSAVAPHGSPSHQLNNVYNPYVAAAGYPAPNGVGQFAGGIPPPGMYNPAMAQPPPAQSMMMPPAGNMMPQQPLPENAYPNPAQAMMSQIPQQQQQQVPHQPQPQPHPQPQPQVQPQPQPQVQPQPHLAHVMLQQQQIVQSHPPIPNAQLPLQQAPPPQATAAAPPPPPTAAAVELSNTQVQAVVAAPAPPQDEPEPAAKSKAPEPATAELISFD